MIQLGADEEYQLGIPLSSHVQSAPSSDIRLIRTETLTESQPMPNIQSDFNSSFNGSTTNEKIKIGTFKHCDLPRENVDVEYFTDNHFLVQCL